MESNQTSSLDKTNLKIQPKSKLLISIKNPQLLLTRLFFFMLRISLMADSKVGILKQRPLNCGRFSKACLT